MQNRRLKKFMKHPKKALFTLAFPIIIIMLVQTLYNIVDTAFVGRIGVEAIAALTFVFPAFFIMIALNAGAAAGTNSMIARFIGEKKLKAAENAAMHGLLISISLAVLIFILGMVFMKPLFSVLGAEGTTLTLAIQYFTIVLAGVFFLSPAFILNNIFIAQGDTKTPMIIEISGLCVNMLLDYIFIFIFHWGVKGAAAATFTSFFVYSVLGFYFIRKRSIVKLSWKSFIPSKYIAKEIISVGFPASLMMILMSVYFAFVNRFMAHFSVNHVAAAGIAGRLQSVAGMPIVALGMAILTLSGMFYGAKRHDLLKGTILFAVKVSVAFTVLVGIILFSFPGIFAGIFTPNAGVIALVIPYLRIDIFAIPFFSISMVINRALQGMGFGLPGFIVNLVRFILISIPLAYLFIFILDYSYISVAVASVIGALTAAIISFAWLEMKIKGLNSS